ncbi:MAG: methylated-DNA--[protein]-cysteine S-methyltransferase [Chitinispirillaceae bacterium]|nr:methylated-DNA--[protein]-cysteine S-methyltransferase [Chitinispirillaceae bacterium]
MNRFFFSFKHPITYIVIYSQEVENKEVISKVVVGSRAEKEIKKKGEVLPTTPLLIKISSLISNYLDGKVVDFSDIPLKMDMHSSFRQKVLTIARKIPYGKLCSYSELAKKSGFSRAIRAVASVMRNNPYPIIIPCHRVILKNGKYGGYCGQKNGKDVELKKSLIELEQRGSHFVSNSTQLLFV